jgi:hypothetical protein
VLQEHAYRLVNTLGTPDVGLMDGTVFREVRAALFDYGRPLLPLTVQVLTALETEGATNSTIQGWATRIRDNMQACNNYVKKKETSRRLHCACRRALGAGRLHSFHSALSSIVSPLATTGIVNC